MPANIVITAKHLSRPDTLALGKVKGKITFLLNISQTVLRVSDSADIKKVFPLGGKFREEDYIFNCAKIGGKYLHGAVPVSVSEKIVALAQQNGAKLENIAGIELLEHRLIEKLCADSAGLMGSPRPADLPEPPDSRCKGKLLVFIAQKPGIRLIVMEREPIGCYFFSNNPEYRERELERIVCLVGDGGFEWAVFGGNCEACDCGGETDWLGGFFAEIKMLEHIALNEVYCRQCGEHSAR